MSSSRGPTHPDVKTGDRVALIREGRVAFTRSGFAEVRWDDGERTTEWIPDLTMMDKPAGIDPTPMADSEPVADHLGKSGSATSPTRGSSPEGRLDGCDMRGDGRAGGRP